MKGLILSASLCLVCTCLILTPNSGWAGLNEDIAYCESQVIPKFGGWSPGRAYTPPTPKSPVEFYCLGIAHWRGLFESKDLAKAAEMFRKAAEQNHPGAQGILGYFYTKGYGVRQDQAQAIAWWRKAAAQGHADSLNALAVVYDNGQGVPVDKNEAMRLYRQAAERGSKEAKQTLASLQQPQRPSSGQQEFDEGVKLYKAKQYAPAAKLFMRAAEMGHARAQLQIGYQYNYGEGLPQNPAEAAKWYLKAATQGNSAAQMNLGNLYENGEGVPENWVEAAKWWRKSAEQVDAMGQFSLGRAYEFGIGVVQNRREAIAWYLKAGGQGHNQASRSARHLQSPDNLQFRNEEERVRIGGLALVWRADPGVMFRNSRECMAWLLATRQRYDQEQEALRREQAAREKKECEDRRARGWSGTC